MVSLFPPGTSCQDTSSQVAAIDWIISNGHSLINRAPRPICVASYRIYLFLCERRTLPTPHPPAPLFWLEFMKSITLNFKKIKN